MQGQAQNSAGWGDIGGFVETAQGSFAMMIARWHIQARFGHKQKAIELLKKWDREIGPKAGIAAGSQRIVAGSVGAKEAEIQAEMQIRDLAELEDIFARIAGVPEHEPWGAAMEPLVVSGSSYWEVFRLIE